MTCFKLFIHPGNVTINSNSTELGSVLDSMVHELSMQEMC